MEKFSKSIEDLIAVQRNTIQKLDSLSKKFSDLSQKIEKYEENLITESKLDQLLSKLSEIDKVQKNISELEKRIPDIKELNIRIEQLDMTYKGLRNKSDLLEKHIKNIEDDTTEKPLQKKRTRTKVAKP